MPQISTLDPIAIRQLLDETVQKYGPWTAHNIYLGHEIYTIGQQILGNEIKAERALRLASDVLNRPLSDLRVLDLACLEGLYAIEFARQGASAVAIEGRQVNIEKARAVKEILGLENLELHQADVRTLSRERFGTFDVVLCLGIFYHLDWPDVYTFARSIADVCTGMAIFDTNICLEPEELRKIDGRTYYGGVHIEHDPAANEEDRLKWVWASLENYQSFWFTRPSLCNLLMHIGFTTVAEIMVPAVIKEYADRVTLFAIKGQAQSFVPGPVLESLPPQEWPEDREVILSPRKRTVEELYSRPSFWARLAGRLFPGASR